MKSVPSVVPFALALAFVVLLAALPLRASQDTHLNFEWCCRGDDEEELAGHLRSAGWVGTTLRRGTVGGWSCWPSIPTPG